MRVLIIEDEPAYQQILKDTLEKERLEIVLASDARQGINEITVNYPDIILLDIMLPGGMNGFDVLERLRADTKTREIPVIVITNLGSEEKVAREIGTPFYFVKSETSINQIVEKVRQLCNIN